MVSHLVDLVGYSQMIWSRRSWTVLTFSHIWWYRYICCGCVYYLHMIKLMFRDWWIGMMQEVLYVLSFLRKKYDIENIAVSFFRLPVSWDYISMRLFTLNFQLNYITHATFWQPLISLFLFRIYIHYMSLDIIILFCHWPTSICSIIIRFINFTLFTCFNIYVIESVLLVIPKCIACTKCKTCTGVWAQDDILFEEKCVVLKWSHQYNVQLSRVINNNHPHTLEYFVSTC